MAVATESPAKASLVDTVLVLASNALTLWWVWRGDWSLSSLMVLFWAENLIVGLLYLARTLAMPGPPVLHGMKFVIVPFFCLHYGLFLGLHALFVFGGVVPDGSAPTAATGFWWALLAAALSSAWQAWQAHRAYVAPTYDADTVAASHQDAKVARRLVTPLMRLTAEPYLRVAILHVVLVIGAIGSLALGSPWFMLLLLVLLKTAYELAQARGWIGRGLRHLN